MKNKIIALDIDGVIVDLVQAMLPLLSDACGRPVRHEDITQYDIGKSLHIEHLMNNIWKRVHDDNLWLSAPPISGALNGLKQLGDYRLVFVTGRPEETTRGFTERWLDANKIQYEQLYFASGSKQVSDLDCIAFIDDHLDHIREAAEAGVRTLLFNQPWNQTFQLPANCRRVHDWKQVIDELRHA